MIYLTHNNGDTAFQVIISGKKVDIYHPNDVLISSNRAQQIFIGRDGLMDQEPKKNGVGNSILIKLGHHQYKFIGENIYTFTSYGEITKYASPIGNNDVPYPYALDEFNNIYLMTEHVVLQNIASLHPDIHTKYNSEPYDYYYRTGIIAGYGKGEKQLQSFDKIKSFHLGDAKYTLTYKPNPQEEYDRMNITFGVMSIKFNNGTTKLLSKEDYVDLIERYGQKMSLMKMLDYHECVERP